jgi:hypothetical protein
LLNRRGERWSRKSLRQGHNRGERGPGLELEENQNGTVTATDNTVTDYNSGTAYETSGSTAFTTTTSTGGNTVEGFNFGFADYDGFHSVYSFNTVNYAAGYG